MSSSEFLIKSDFAVAGIAAPTGQSEAVVELLASLPASAPVSVIVFQYGSPPDERAALMSALRGRTAMPVIDVSDGIPIECGHIYLLPAEPVATVQHGSLRIATRAADEPRQRPLDLFFRSLAEDMGNQAIGIALSGNESDWATGFEAVRQGGGITFAQDPTALHQHPPARSATAGAVDFILRPRDIALALPAVAGKVTSAALLTKAADLSGPAWQRVLKLLRERCSVDLSGYRRGVLQKRLARRLALHRLDNLEEYIGILEDDRQEVLDLLDDMLSGGAEFFRTPRVFESLIESALPALLANRHPEEPFRVWVPGCAAGRETYSVAIALSEALDKVGCPLQVFGTDISERAIDAARQAIYPESISASVPEERLNRFFVRVEGGYRIVPRIREICIFARHDVTKDPALPHMELIVARDLFSHLGPALQSAAARTFSYALESPGCLVLNEGEALGPVLDHFHALDSANGIYVRRDSVRPSENAPLPPARTSFSSGRRTASGVGEVSLLDRAADRMLVDDYAPPGFLLNSSLDVVRFRGDLGPYLIPPTPDAGLFVLQLVRPSLVEPLRKALDAAETSGGFHREVIQSGKSSRLAIVVRPVFEFRMERHFLVAFEAGAPSTPFDAPQQTESAADSSLELTSMRDYMQRLVEKLRSANEDAQAANEELRSAVEQLQTAREELQSTNEELAATNDEMLSRNAELNEANSDLWNLLSSLRMPILMLDRELRLRRYTPLSVKHFNLLPRHIGRPVGQLLDILQIPNLPGSLNHVIATGEVMEQEVRDARGHWHWLRVHPYVGASERIDGVVLQMVDIDELKRSMELLSRAREYADAIVSAVREGLVVLDRELRVMSVNRSFCGLFGGEEEDYRGKSVFGVLDGTLDELPVREMLESISGKGSARQVSKELELEFVRGGERTAWLLSARQIGAGLAEGGLLLAIEDISDRKRLAEAKYRRLFEAAADGILIADAATGAVTDVNPRGALLLGATREEVLKKRFWEIESLPAGGPEAMERIMAEGTVRFTEGEVDRLDGRRIFEAQGSLYLDVDTPVIQIVLRDVTERRELERQILQKAKLESLGVLAGGVAHDFNNLLTGIMGNASLALLDSNGTLRYQGALRDVVKASQRAAELTSQMLAYAGKGNYVIGPVNLSEMVRDIAALVRSSMSKSIDLAMNLSPSLPPVEGDASQLQQIAMNLIINAAEALEDSLHGTVRVTTSVRRFNPEGRRFQIAADDLRAGAFVVLEVADSGCGMDPAVVERIFDPFFTTKFTGRGLGLAAVQGIVRRHGGALTVDTAPGRGTTFHVFLPAAAQTAAAPLAEEPQQEDFAGSGTILIVDDEQGVLGMAKVVLESYGYKALLAENGEKAVDVMDSLGREVDAVILDLAMPVMGGQEALTKIRAHNPNVRVILSTGYDATDAVERFGLSGVAAVLQKPYTAEGLLRTVKAAVGRPRETGSPLTQST